MDPLLILLFIILFLLSGFFSGTEIALMSLPTHKIDFLLKNKKFGSKALKKIKSKNDRLLITILIGNNLVNVYTAALATQLAISFAENISLDEAKAVGVVTGIITFLLLLFGEIIPKSIATKNSEKISLLVAPIYNFLMVILFPIILLMELLIKVFTGKKKAETMSEEEIESFIDLGVKKGGLDQEEHEKIKGILELDDTIVEEIMTPRVKIEALEINTKIDEAVLFFLKHTHSRIPVYIKTIDNIEYFITPRDLIREYQKGNNDKTLKDIELHKVLKVPINQSVSKLFDTLKKTRKILAIVMDEYGGISGLVSIEDIIEEVFGEIRDETDKETDYIEKIEENFYIVESETLIEDLLKKFDLGLENIGLNEKEFDGQTVGYIITNVIGDFPTKNQIITFDIIDEYNGKIIKNLKFKILEIHNAKIGKIDVKIEEI